MFGMFVEWKMNTYLHISKRYSLEEVHMVLEENMVGDLMSSSKKGGTRG